jgi:hypothetical protein
MSSTPATLTTAPAADTSTRRWPAWLREPLLHFAVLGGALFLLDHALVARADDPHAIVFTRQDEAQSRELFKASRGREPTSAEMTALRQVWVDNEVLYREGLALQVDKGDQAIRERVIFKALSVVDASTKLPPVTDEALRRWFESHRAKYDEPPRFDFAEATLVGDSSEAAARAFADALNAGASGDQGAGLRIFKGRPRENLLQSYGAEFTRALEGLAPQRWQALQTPGGWRVVRLDRMQPGKPGVYDSLRPVVQQDWTDATLSEQRSAAVHALARKYAIRNEGAAR